MPFPEVCGLEASGTGPLAQRGMFGRIEPSESSVSGLFRKAIRIEYAMLCDGASGEDGGSAWDTSTAHDAVLFEVDSVRA